MNPADKRYSILFVCLGNICRSPAAAAIFSTLARKNGRTSRYKIDSAGTLCSWPGNDPDPRATKAAAARGYKLIHKARRLTKEDLESFDLILAMEPSLQQSAWRLTQNLPLRNRVRLLAEFAPPALALKDDSIPDPYYSGDEAFATMITQLEDCCLKLFHHTETLRRK